jgi:hypothetical protein
MTKKRRKFSPDFVKDIIVAVYLDRLDKGWEFRDGVYRVAHRRTTAALKKCKAPTDADDVVISTIARAFREYRTDR